VNLGQTWDYGIWANSFNRDGYVSLVVSRRWKNEEGGYLKNV